MKKLNSKSKPIIQCQICKKNLIKKYISQHIRRAHKSNDYCSIIKRGMTYKGFRTNLQNNISKKFFSVIYVIKPLKCQVNIII